jgi:hypothetical protein
MRVSLGNEKPFASTSVEAVNVRQRHPFPWPGRVPLLILKLPRIAGHGNKLQSGKRGQLSRRAVGTEIEVAGADELSEPYRSGQRSAADPEVGSAGGAPAGTAAVARQDRYRAIALAR